MYELLAGHSPYYSDDIPAMYENIKKAKLKLPRLGSDRAMNLLKVSIVLFIFLMKKTRFPKEFCVFNFT